MIALLAGAVPPRDADAQQSTAATRPYVLFVHGRGQENRADTAIMNEWLGALKVGLKNANAADLIGPNDVGFVFNQHAFEARPQLDPACVAPGQPTSYDIGVPSRSEIQTSYETARPPLFPKRSLEDVVFDATRASTNRLPEEWIQWAALHTGATDTWTYLLFRTEYCSVEHVMRNGFARTDGRPLIIVAHSMGTLVTYRYLLRDDTARAGAHARVLRFITVGSQLAAKSIANRLSDDSTPPYPYPPVDSWVNLRDERDPLAWSLFLFDSALYAPGGSARAMPVDRRVNVNEAWHHTIAGYLENPLVITAIGESWCGALGADAPASCNAFRIGVGASDAATVPTSGVDVGHRTARFGVPAAIGAAGGAAVFWSKGKGATLAAAAGGALLGAFVSALIDWARPTQ